MTWQQLTLHLPAQHIDAISDLLTNAGAVAISLTSDKAEEIFEPLPGDMPLWEQTKIMALFEQTSDLSKVIDFLEMVIEPTIALRHHLEIIEEQNWQQRCQDDFHPICFKNKLWIYPSWHAIPDPSIAHMILDPGLAFGTGAHATTALCLEWLTEHIKPGDIVIDYGCGSGILAIAALKLGAQKVWAIDIDPQALEVTQENARRNNISTTDLIAILPNQLPTAKYDVLIANILANPLIELAPDIANLVKIGGKLALSGILKQQAISVSDAYANWFSLNRPQVHEEWIRIDGERT